MKEIKYIALYDLKSFDDEDRTYSLSAFNKMNYIITVLKDRGYTVKIVSPAWTKREKGFFHKRTVQIDGKSTLTCFSTFGAKRFLGRKLRLIYSLFQLFLYLLKNAKKDESILVYHTVLFSVPIRMAKFFKRFRLVLETEEIYNNATKLAFPLNTFEKKLIKTADAYIFSTELLSKELDIHKPFICCNGMYSPTEVLAKPADDGKIHLIYTGIIDFDKRGAFNAVDATKFLDENYVLHILGFGEVDKLKETIEELNKTNKCKIVFDGLLSGDAFIKYCQQCHIGLSTQTMSGEYLQTSFPSKVLSYMCMGLPVVSCFVECVSASKIGDLVTYYYSDVPEHIAFAIKAVVNKNMREIIIDRMLELNREFSNELDKLILNS